VSKDPNLARLRVAVDGFGRLAAAPMRLEEGAKLLADLVGHDDWLPDAFAQPDPERYRQYLLHCDPDERFSIVSFVWGPGQDTPIHDHRTWGLVGVLRGAELVENWERRPAGMKQIGTARRLEPGQVDIIDPTVGEIHRVANAFADRASISIHVYGGNIGRIERSTYALDGTPKLFVSGYSNEAGPDI
jgi:predicted metal-dependent enzyme (double-stranded beta helix superfamily)